MALFNERDVYLQPIVDVRSGLTAQDPTKEPGPTKTLTFRQESRLERASDPYLPLPTLYELGREAAQDAQQKRNKFKPLQWIYKAKDQSHRFTRNTRRQIITAAAVAGISATAVGAIDTATKFEVPLPDAQKIEEIIVVGGAMITGGMSGTSEELISKGRRALWEVNVKDITAHSPDGKLTQGEWIELFRKDPDPVDYSTMKKLTTGVSGSVSTDQMHDVRLQKLGELRRKRRHLIDNEKSSGVHKMRRPEHRGRTWKERYAAEDEALIRDTGMAQIHAQDRRGSKLQMWRDTILHAADFVPVAAIAGGVAYEAQHVFHQMYLASGSGFIDDFPIIAAVVAVRQATKILNRNNEVSSEWQQETLLRQKGMKSKRKPAHPRAHKKIS